MQNKCALLSITLLSFVSAAQALVVNITYTDGAGEGFNDVTLGPARRAALEHALSVWTSQLGGSVPLSLKAEFNSLGGTATTAVLGRAGSTASFRDEPEFPLAGTWYPSPLASQLKDMSLPATSGAHAGFHMRAEFNSDIDGPSVFGDVSFHYGTGSPPAGTVDFISVALHEFGHAFGFFDLVSDTTGEFPDDFPDTYSRNLKRAGAVNKTFAAMTNTERLAAITSGDVYWFGAHVKAAGVASPAPFVNASGEVEMFAPNPYQTGSSISHWDQGHTPNLLMEPSLASVYRSIGVTWEAMEDIGWTSPGSEGEGEGEGEEDPCPWEGPCPDFDAEGANAYGTLSLVWNTADLDATGIIDSWETALFREVLCSRTGPLHAAAQCAFTANLAQLRDEPAYAGITAVENALAALLSVSTELQAGVKAGLSLTGAYQVAVTDAKAAGEPFAPTGNPDADGFANKQEFTNTINAGLTRSDYVFAALHPLLDGARDASALPLSAVGIAVAGAGILAAGARSMSRRTRRKDR